ncbi:MAG: hypothetical protein QMC81_06575 [Thermoanaerobacterales bacterium]|nr:hypothetical protein [Bacillota bacterium]MDI6907132.1 hypothetical protein [Thermoanaerobacterales bacterium]
MPKKNDKKAERPRTTAFESVIGTPARGGEEITTGQNPDEIAERAGTNVEFKG